VSRLLCDAGVWIAAARADDRFHDASARLVGACAWRNDALGALDLTLYEAANVAVVRSGSPETAAQIVALIRRTAAGAIVPWNAEMLGLAAQLAAQHRLSVYDAAHVATSRALGWPLVSTDIRDLVSRGLAIAPDQVVL